MGVQSQGVANGHDCVGTGGMATLMIDCGLPTLNVIDAKWVNANPAPSTFVGPYTLNSYATRTNVLLAGLDPVALDYWAAKHILIQTANLIGYDDPYAVDPDSSAKGNLGEAFGVWLNKSRDEFLQNNINVTSNEQQMNVYLYTHLSPIKPGLNIYMWIGIIGAGIIASITILIIWITKKRKNKIKLIPTR
jgi:hypothetical protein